MFFMIKDESMLVTYNNIWKKIKKALNIKFHNILVYDEKHINLK